MLTANRQLLDAVCMDEVAFGHTSGLLQTKAEFIDQVCHGDTRWNALEFRNPRNRIVGDCALSHFRFVGQNQRGTETNRLEFDVVLVWRWQDGRWQMLVRQGYNKA
jgi:hypothetical protein